MNGTVMKNCDQTFCLWMDVCHEIFICPLWVENSTLRIIFLIFKVIFILFLSSQHLVHDGVGLYRRCEGFVMLRSTEFGNWMKC